MPRYDMQKIYLQNIAIYNVNQYLMDRWNQNRGFRVLDNKIWYIRLEDGVFILENNSTFRL